MSSKRVKIKDLVDLINGHPFKPEDWGQDGRKIIRIQNLNNPDAEFNYTTREVDEKYIVRNGDILISWAGSLSSFGAFKWSDKDALLNQHIFKVVFKTEEVDHSYFQHVANQALKELLQKTRGLGLKHLKKGQIEEYEFELPDSGKQIRIAKGLNLIQKLISVRIETLDLLHDYLSNSFLKMFLENRQFLEDSNSWGTIDEVIESSVYGTSKKANTNGAGIPVLRMNNITYRGEIKLDNLKWVEFYESESQRLSLQNGDVLFNRTNSKELVGKTAVWDRGEGYTFAGYLVKIVLKDNRMTPYYFSGYLNSKFGKKILFSKGKSSGSLVNFSPPLLKSQKILIPPMELQNKYDALHIEINNQKKQLRKSLELLEEFFEAFLYKTFGKVKEAESDDIDRLMNDEIQLELFLNTINTSDYETEEEYNLDIERLHKILDRTILKNNEDSKYLKGIVQRLEGDKIILETNKEYKYRKSDEATQDKDQ
ncbi:type I restriction enzyme, S subunit [Algoriphagus locisalis]|uniref:Type I restriction enzyme, S subunit n=1 Tax=Algoriphagus locisalis TaxID=305507 RepID=A0A1I7E505_9BACT|nr:restriction endonuclease subunit S [Algoriphagus locisalis]SFU19021.1 type I restriction enzyme, S subunit [Algoriphagus locisalis]